MIGPYYIESRVGIFPVARETSRMNLHLIADLQSHVLMHDEPPGTEVNLEQDSVRIFDEDLHTNAHAVHRSNGIFTEDGPGKNRKIEVVEQLFIVGPDSPAIRTGPAQVFL